MEIHRLRKPQALATALLMLAAVALPLAGQALANHGSRTLNVEPEQTTRGVGTMQTFTATLSAAADVGSGTINIDFENENGPNDTDATSPTSPDQTCSIPSGQTECTITYTGTIKGTDTWRAWIDHDGLDATDDSDKAPIAEGRNEGTAPGDAEGGANCSGALPPTFEPDCTDVVEVTWTAGAPAAVDCDDATGPDTEKETNPAGGGNASNETYTCTVTDAFGNTTNDFDPVATGTQTTKVFAEVENGVNDPDASDGASYDDPDADYVCTVGGAGTCTITVTQNENETGTADVCFWGDDVTASEGDTLCAAEATNESQDPDGSDTGNDLADQVEKTWAARAASGLDAELETDTNNLNENHTITATIYDQFGQTFNGNTTVKLELFDDSPSDTDNNTPASPDLSCTTTNSSSCTVTYTQATTKGTDLLCVWVGTNPSMTGDNTNGTCDGENLNDPDDAAGSPDAAEPETDDVDVVQKTWQDPNAASRLDCTPETDNNSTGTAHTVTCTATNAAGATVKDTNLDAEASGANDPDGGNTMTTPDFSCVTGNDGTCSFTHGPGGTTGAGVTTYRAWIDSDNNNTSVEADETEGRDEAATAGAKAEPDDTDVVEKTWTGGPATVTMTPESDSAAVGTCNAFTITVTDSAQQPVSGVIVDVEQRHSLAGNATPDDEPTVAFCAPTSGDGPNPSAVDESKGDLDTPDENPDNKGTAGGETSTATDAAGKVTIGITITGGQGSDGSGTVTVDAFFESTDNDDPDTGEPKDTSTKTWEISNGRTIDCEPETDSNETGTDHTVTCTVEDRFGGPVEGEGVTFTETGPGDFTTPAQQSTDANGQASATTSSDDAGTETITGTITDDTTGAEPGEVDECDKAAGDPSGAPAGNCSDDVTKTWEEPPVTECNDGTDNDQDGQTDFGDDPGCSSDQDDSESSEGPEDTSQASVVTIRYEKSDKEFAGRVSSVPDDRCLDDRTVKLKKKRSGKDKNVGSDTTKADGTWSIKKKSPDGKYYAKVKELVIILNPAGDTLTCESAKSPTIKV